MTTRSSQIASIVDYTASIAGNITGVTSIFGVGQSAWPDPINPGQLVQAAPSNPSAPFQHWSYEPSAPAVEWVSQEGTVELTWQVPMRLWLPAGDLAFTRSVMMPFYDGYLRAFISDRTLGDLVLRTRLNRFAAGGDPNWSWLDIGLEAVERVNYGS